MVTGLDWTGYSRVSEEFNSPRDLYCAWVAIKIERLDWMAQRGACNRHHFLVCLFTLIDIVVYFEVSLMILLAITL